MIKFETEYKLLIKKILEYGSKDQNRTDVDTLLLFGEDITFDMSKGEMPVITGKKIFWRKAIAEFEWMKLGLTHVKYLKECGVHWWDQYADSNGYLGKTYGHQIRNFDSRWDQFASVINELKNGGRRGHLTFWNPTELNETALPPCYTGMTFVLTHNQTVLNMNMQFRSSDVFLGLPYDFIVGAMFLKHFAKETGKKLGTIKYSLDNAHIYMNHLKQCDKYLVSETYNLPVIDKDNRIKGYKCSPHIEAKLNN